MEKILNLIQPFKQYVVEAALIGISVLVVAASVIIYVVNVQAAPKKSAYSSNSTKKAITGANSKADKNSEESSTIVVDITGAVMNPDSYSLPADARLKDALTKAGGLSELADKDFFYRNFNLARQIADQEKIYVPSITEVSSGIFKESYRIIDSPTISAAPLSSTSDSSESGSKIHINSATAEELDTLPSVGTTTVQKIIENRPYTQLDDLTSKKVLGAATFSKIKDLIDL